MRTCVALAAALAASSPALLSAQTPSTPTPTQTQPASPTAAVAYPKPAKWFVNLHGGAQVGSQDADRNATFTLYDEQATFESRQLINGGGLIDIGGAARLYQNYGVGVSYAAFESTNDVQFNGSLPHPLLFDRPRTFSGASAADHKERGVHIQALWFIPFTDKIDFTVGIGPSFFSVEQGFVRGIEFGETPPFDSVTIDTVNAVTLKESGVGFNLGGNMTYAITRLIGASVMLRYSRGSLTFNLGEGQTADLDAGGFQFGAGIGVRF